jgi:pilus assembly protein Flp/PilA
MAERRSAPIARPASPAVARGIAPENTGATGFARAPFGCVAQPLPLLAGVVAVAPMRDRKSHTHITQRVDGRAEETMNLITRLRALKRDTAGQDLLEYALLVALIALVAYGAVQLTGTNVNSIFTNIAGKLGTAAGGGA